VARAAIYGEPTIACGPSPTSEVVAVAKRHLAAGDKLGDIGSADYYGWLRVASDAAGMLPLGLAAGASVTQPVSRGQDIPRSAVRLPEDSFAASLRKLQETSTEPGG
jgi:predicted homoserine dehydrogenase-like protein